MKSITTWILLADGTRARIVCNDGPGRGVKPVFEETLHGRNLPGREIDSDRPGRTFDSQGQGRHAKEAPTDPRENEKQHFIRGLAALLHKEAKRGNYDRLVLVAPPKALGYLRNALSDAVRERVTGEIDKDLVHLPMQEVAPHLGKVLAI